MIARVRAALVEGVRTEAVPVALLGFLFLLVLTSPAWVLAGVMLLGQAVGS